MAGHSKWSNIKRKKGAVDAKRGKVFTKIGHEITVAVREGGGPDVTANARLRLAVDKAKSVNMPNTNIERAIKRATGELKDEKEQFEIMYEGYGPGGVAVMVETVTDNKNRTAGEVRSAFSKSGGSLGETNCVNWMFSKRGLLVIAKNAVGEEEITDLVIEAGADDISDEGDVWEITTEPNDFHSVQSALGDKMTLELAEIQMLPQNRTEVSGKEAEQMIRLLETLEDLDDVVNVWTNCEFPDEEAK